MDVVARCCVITFYAAQVECIRRQLRQHKLHRTSVHTVGMRSAAPHTTCPETPPPALAVTTAVATTRRLATSVGTRCSAITCATAALGRVVGASRGCIRTAVHRRRRGGYPSLPP